MKKWTYVVLLMLLVMVVAGCGAQMKEYVIKVDGTEGATFDAVYMYQVDRTPTSEKTSGAVPAEYPIEAETLSCEITKTSAEGTINVSLVVNGETVAEKELTDQGQSFVLQD